MIKVVDDYFPQWMVEQVGNYVSQYPVALNNASDDESAYRFFGAVLMQDNMWVQHPWWFVDYFNMCIYNDILKDRVGEYCQRVLINGQPPTFEGGIHQDNENNIFMSVVYHAHGDSGDTIFYRDGEEFDRITFKPGRILIFPSNLYHRGAAPENGYRCSIGYLYPHVPVAEAPTIHPFFP